MGFQMRRCIVGCGLGQNTGRDGGPLLVGQWASLVPALAAILGGASTMKGSATMHAR